MYQTHLNTTQQAFQMIYVNHLVKFISNQLSHQIFINQILTAPISNKTTPPRSTSNELKGMKLYHAHTDYKETL